MNLFACVRRLSRNPARSVPSAIVWALLLGALLLSLPQATGRAQAAVSGLVAAYGFDEGSGTTAADASGNGNGGTIGTATWSTLGRFGNALSFNGSNSMVTVPDSPALRFTNAMTLEAWVFPTAISSSWRDVVYKGNDNYYLMATTTTTSRPAMGGIVAGSHSEAFGNAALATNAWSHLAGTWDGTTMRLYVNGVLVGSATASGSVATSSNPLTIGGDTFYTQFFAGRIDEVRVYNTVLSPLEIQADMTAPVAGGPPDPTPPSAPGTLTAVAPSAASVDLSWGVATDNVAVTGYRIERCQGASCMSFAEVASAGSTQFTDMGLSSSTTYRYRVRAVDGAGNLGPYSNIANATTPAADFANETVVSGLNFVTTMRFLPDGKKLMGEIGGTIRVVPVGANQPSPTPFNVIAGAAADADAGLHDIVLDPNFSSNGFYYVHYAHTQGSSYRDRLSRFTAASGWNSTVAGSEVVLWQDDAASTSGAHHGASLNFGPDGKLYLSMGDNGAPADAQSLTSYHGKILRFNPDGSAPADNPFVDGAGANKDEIWAYGLRNPYRLSFDSVTGNLYAGDVGGNDDETAWEELDVIERGKNYGWPQCEGPCSLPGVTGPIYSYPHSGRDAAIMGGVVYRGSAYPATFRGNYFFADYAQNWIKRLTLDPTGKVVTGVFNFEPIDGSVDNIDIGDPVWLQEGPDGSLYYLDLSFDEQNIETNAGTLRRLRFAGSGNQPPNVVANGAPLQGQPPLTVDFSSAGTSDPEGDSLTYAWNFGDGGTSSAPNTSHTYASSGRYNVTLTVSDGSNAPFATLTVVVGNPPAGQILAPTDGALFVAGDHIAISGNGTNTEDGSLPASAFSWSVVFHHEGHLHPAVGPITGTKGFTFDIPTSGHDFSGFTRYEIVLTVTDSDGLTHRSSVFVFPDKVTQSFNTVPSGLTLVLDGISKVTPFSIDEVKGFQHTIDAPSQTFGGTSYSFSSWSDGGAQTHLVTTPTANQSYTATFQAASGPSPVAAYSFNEGTGTTVADASGTGNSGTIGTATWSTQGKNGNALSFNGSNSMVTVPDSTALRLANAMTLEAWVFPTAISSSWRDVVYKGNDNYYLMATTTSSSRPAGGGLFSGAYGETFGTAALATNTWTHLATTYDGTTLRLFVNGVQVSSMPQTGTLTMSANALNIGGDTLYGQYFTGRIDDVRVYNAALTFGQIQNDMNTPVGGTPTPDTTPPTAPSGLTATAVGPTQVNLSWTAATDNVAVTGYRVERCQGAGCSTFAEVGTPTGTSFNDTGRTASTTYRYRVRASDAVPNLGPYSGIATATTPAAADTTPPTAPSGLTATAVGPTQVNLSWTAATDNVAVTGYRVERCQGAGCSTFAEVGTPTGTSFNDTGRTASTTYRYRVRASDAVPNLGPYSGIATATTPAAADTTPPTAPSGLTATAVGPTQVNLSWTAATDNVAVTGYRVERCQGAGCSTFAEVGTPTGTSFNDTGRTASTTYRYRVRASDAVPNLGPYSGIATATTPAAADTTPPTAPSGLTATAVGPTQVNLSWTAATDNVAVTGYRVERCQGAGCSTFAEVGTPTGTSFNDTGRTASTTYRYRVRASDAVPNLGPYSGIATATTPAAADTTPPTAPSGLTATAVGPTQVNLSWTAATDNVAVTGYRVERCQGAGCSTFAEVGTPTGTSFNDTGRTASTTYRYRVRASDAVPNLGPYSGIATATTPAAADTTPPTAPSGLTATAVGPTQVNLSWTAATDNVAVTGYRVERCQGAGCSTFAEVGTPTGTSFNDTTASPSTSYTYRVRASDAAPNLGPYSGTATTTTPPVTPGSGLVAAYSFNEGTGMSVADASGIGNTGTIGNATWTNLGKNGNALSFNGSNARVTVADTPSLRLTTAMTLEAWVFPTTVTSNWRDIVFKGDDNYYLMATTTSSSRPGAGGIFSGAHGEVFATTALPTNTWTHLAVTWNGATLRLYVNGVEVATKAQTGTLLTSANPLNIGGDTFYSQYFAGRIDDVRIYSTALSAAQVQADMNTSVGP